MASDSVVPSSSSRQRTPLSVVSSGMKLRGSLQFISTNGNGYFKGRGHVARHKQACSGNLHCIAALWGTSACRSKHMSALVFYTQVSRWWE